MSCNRGDTILRHGGLHTDLNQYNQQSTRDLTYIYAPVLLQKLYKNYPYPKI